MPPATKPQGRRRWGCKDEMIEDVMDWGADLIVMGSHGWRGINRFLLGSVSERSPPRPCSVEIVRIIRVEPQRTESWS